VKFVLERPEVIRQSIAERNLITPRKLTTFWCELFVELVNDWRDGLDGKRLGNCPAIVWEIFFASGTSLRRRTSNARSRSLSTTLVEATSGPATPESLPSEAASSVLSVFKRKEPGDLL
jgi:hypothetical protein